MRSGSRAATSVTKSHSPLAATTSMMRAVSSRICTSSFDTMRGVKPLFTSNRYRVCIGGSMLSIIIRCCARSSSAISVMSAEPRADENRSISRFTSTTP